MGISQDHYRYTKKGWGAFLKMFLSNPCFRFVVFLRASAQFSILNPIGLLARVFLHINKSSYGIQIPHITKIGKGLFIGHYGTIVVSSEAVIGENCNIAQGVTIGRINKGPRKGAPKIGNQVWIGANAVLVGDIQIGDNVLIAPLSFVNFDVPSNAMVIGNPAKIVEGKTSEDYINFHF